MNKVRIGNIICAAVSLILMICMFVPFWTVPETGESVSISAYVGFPEDEKALQNYLKDSAGDDYNINSVVIGPVFIIVFGAIGIALCLLKSGSGFCALLPAAAGCGGAWGYITQAALQLGSGWGLHLALCILLVAIAAFTVFNGIKEN